MRIYYADISGADESRALYPGTGKSRGSAFGVSLLAAAYEEYAAPKASERIASAAVSGFSMISSFSGVPVLQKLSSLIPCRNPFATPPELCYSVSHSRKHVVVALSETPVGIDTEPADRAVPQSLIEKLTTPEEREFLSFLDIWTLRESYFKLTGEGSLRSLRIFRKMGKIITPRADVFCKQYKTVPGAVISVCAFEDDFPEEITEIPVERLLKKEKPLQSYPKGFRLD